jgi:hypothetical protein
MRFSHSQYPRKLAAVFGINYASAVQQNRKRLRLHVNWLVLQFQHQETVFLGAALPFPSQANFLCLIQQNVDPSPSTG